MKEGTESSQALYNRAFYVWHEGFLKNSDTSVNTSPQPLAFVCNVSIVDLSSSETFAGFITDQGYLYCWLWPETICGRNDIKINPTAVTSVEEFACRLSCGYNHISCITENSSLYIWMFGREEVRSGELSLESFSNPIVLSDWEFPVRQIRSGSSHMLVLLSNNDLYCVRFPEKSEFEQVKLSELVVTKVDISERIIEIQAGVNTSAYLCRNCLYYQFLCGEGEDGLDSSTERCQVRRAETETISMSHKCGNEGCGYRISAICLFKGFIAMGVIFDCETAQLYDPGASGYFSHIFMYGIEKREISVVKNSGATNLFRSLHWLCDHLCAIFADGTIWFRDTSIISEEKSDIVVRPKGDTKLFFASASGKCLIINISQNMLDNSPLSNAGRESNMDHCDETMAKTEENLAEKETGCDKLGFAEADGRMEVTGSSFPSNTTFEASDQDGGGDLRRVHSVDHAEDAVSEREKARDDGLPSYQRPTISSVITKRPQRHSFLRKGEGKMRLYKSTTSSERSDSKLPSNFLGEKLENNSGGGCLAHSGSASQHSSRKKLQEYETRILNLERENRRILDILQETKRRYLSDVKALYTQLKERSDEKFPLKSLIEQLQKELFVEREEKSRLKEDYESVKLQLQNEICNKDIKRDLLNARLVIERDRLSKEKEELERQHQELSNKDASLEILVTELSSKYSQLQQDHESLVTRHDEIDQIHTLTVNQLSKSELELYELRKELELSKASKSTSVNELYEYIGELESSLKDLKAANDRVVESSCRLQTAPTVVEQGDERTDQLKQYLTQKLLLLKEERWSELIGGGPSDSEVGHLVDDVFRLFVEKINSLKRKVSVLEKCIKVRKDDINVLVENR